MDEQDDTNSTGRYEEYATMTNVNLNLQYSPDLKEAYGLFIDALAETGSIEAALNHVQLTDDVLLKLMNLLTAKLHEYETAPNKQRYQDEHGLTPDLEAFSQALLAELTRHQSARQVQSYQLFNEMDQLSFHNKIQLSEGDSQ